MQTFFDYYEDDICPWYYFDSSYKTLLGSCLIVFGIFGVLLNGWLFATFVFSRLLTFKSHILVLNLTTVSLARNLLGFPFASSSAFAKRWIFGSSSCQIFAFFNNFLGVFQMCALAVIAFERFYETRHFKNEKQSGLVIYWVLVLICWMYALALAVPPLFGLGVYTCDVTNTVCTLDWSAVDSSSEQLVFTIFLIMVGGLLPVFTIIYFIIKTIPMERRYYKSEYHKDKRRLTKSVHAASVIILLMWSPAAVLALWQWVPQFIYGYKTHVPPTLVIVAAISSEAATSVPVLSYLVYDERLRAALLGRMRNHYALLRPDRAKKYIKI